MLNQRSYDLLQDFLPNSSRMGMIVHDDGVNVPVIDCGVECRGSLGAGLAMARVCTAGLAEISITVGSGGVWAGPQVQVHTDQPVAACMAAQYAGWKIEREDYFAMGSGPMRAAAGKEELFDSIHHRESCSVAVGVLEANQLPTPHVCKQLAGACNVETRGLTLLVAPTTSLAGTVQVVARSVETALHKLHELGFDIAKVVSGWGVAPLPPVSSDHLLAIGRTNDAILYGGRVNLWVDCDDDEMAAVIQRVPSNSSKQYGRPFAEIFKDHDCDFYKIDPLLFSPGFIRVNNLATGNLFTAGTIDAGVLKRSFSD